MRQRPVSSEPVRPDISAHIQDLFRRYTTVQSVKSLSTEEARTGLRALLDNLETEKSLMIALYTGVKKYADENLNKVGNLYTNEAANIGSTADIAPKRSIKNERVTAVNRLLELLSTSCGKDVFDYITTPAFQDLIGSNEIKVKFWHTHLAECTEAFIRGYQEYKKICTNEQLLLVLTQVYVMGFIESKELAELFWHYDPMLMAEIIVNVYERHDFTDVSELGKMDYTGLQHLLAQDPFIVEMVNNVRKNIYKSQVLPPDVLTPGKNDVYEESLNRFQRFQFNDATIFALENSLHQEFGHLMVNNIVGDDGKRVKVLDNNAPYHFYMLSAAKYMLIDPSTKNPEHMKTRFDDFCKDVRSLMFSIKKYKHDKSIIVFGMVNFDGDHYLPYFIYQQPGHCPSVLTQDPSARTYSEAELRANSKLVDSKVNTLKKVEKAFNEVFIFSGCHFFDHDIDQMLRQLDCGTHAYTTLHDALRTTMSNQPLLRIYEQDGVLRLNTSQLTVQGEHVGVDAYTRKLVYAAQLEKDSLANRARVQAVLEHMDEVRVFTVREGSIEHPLPLNYRDTFVVSNQTLLKYNYFEEVDRQNIQDAREFNLSSLCSHLMSSNEGKAVIDAVVTSFRHKLARPSETLVMQFIKKTINPVELSTLTSAHGGSLRKVCEELVVLLLKEKMPKQFIASFTVNVLAKLPDSFDLDAEALVAEFLKENAAIYNHMTTHPQRIIKREMLKAAHDAVNAKLLSLHLARFKEYYNQSVGYQLQILLMTDIGDIPTRMIAHYWAEYTDIRASIDYLERNDLASLRAFVVDATESAISDIVKYTTEYFVRWFAERFKNLSEIINYYVQIDSANSTWSLRALTDKLPNDFPFYVKRYTEDSIVAIRILQDVNDNLERMAKAQLQAVCNAGVQAFVASADVRAAIVQSGDLNELLSYLSRFDADITFGNQLVISLLQRFGNRETIAESDLNHLQAGEFLMSGLRMAIRLVYTAELERHFALLAADIIANTNIVQFAVYDSLSAEVRIPANLLPHLLNVLSTAEQMITLAFKFGIVLNNATNYQYFATYFTERVAETLANRYAKVKGLVDKAEIMRSAIKEFESQFSLNTFFHISGIENIFSLQDQFDSQFASHASHLSNYLIEQTRPIFNDKCSAPRNLIPNPSFCPTIL